MAITIKGSGITSAELAKNSIMDADINVDAEITVSKIHYSTPTGAEIKALYEVEPSAFTDDQFIKLAGLSINDLSDATTQGINNIGIGTGALSDPNLRGSYNSAFGYRSLYNNESGYYNTAFGEESLLNNTSANNNTAFGYQSLLLNKTGTQNVGCGFKSLYRNDSGNANVAIGYSAGSNAILSNNTYLGCYRGSATDSNQVFLSAGQTLYQTISSARIKGGAPVMNLVIETNEETGEVLKQVRIADVDIVRDKIAAAIAPLLTKIEALEAKLRGK